MHETSVSKQFTEPRKLFVGICGCAEMYIASRHLYFGFDFAKPWTEDINEWLPHSLEWLAKVEQGMLEFQAISNRYAQERKNKDTD